MAGLTILDLVSGYQNLIIIDAIETQRGEPGQIYRLSEEAFRRNSQHWSIHGAGLGTILELGRRCGCRVPENVVIYAVEVEDTQTWRRGCTPNVRKAIPMVTQLILRAEFSDCIEPSVN